MFVTVLPFSIHLNSSAWTLQCFALNTAFVILKIQPTQMLTPLLCKCASYNLTSRLSAKV